MARFSTLLLALAIASPALYAGFVTHRIDTQTALLRLLIAVPVAAVMLGLFRMVTQGYGGKPKDEPRKPTAANGEPEPAGDEPLRAEAVAGEPFPARRAEDGAPAE